MKTKQQILTLLTKQQKLAYIVDPAHALWLLKDKADEVLLLESADIVTKRSEKSLLFLDLALRIEARHHRVQIEALVPEVLPLLAAVQKAFIKNVVANQKNAITIGIEPLYEQQDVLQKMRSLSCLDVLRCIMNELIIADPTIKKNSMLAGVFSYDFLDHFEKLPAARSDHADVPDYLFYLPLTVVVFNHRQKKTTIYAHGLADENIEKRQSKAVKLMEQAKHHQAKPIELIKTPLNYEVDVAQDDFYNVIERCKEHIYAGDVYQIVPSRLFSCPIGDTITSYRTLRKLNPSPYMFFMQTKQFSLFGASPETFIKVDKGGKRVCIRPIAGTRRRGFDHDGIVDEELDSREQVSLCLDEKELAEHMMLLDLARNDIASVSKPKSRRISRLLSVDRYSHVMHLVSEVSGALQKNFDALSAYQACMNMGTLMGAPKVRAAELLRDIETSKRGFYGGAIGYLDFCGDMDTAIIIRSALVKNHRAHIRAGCGVVFDSTPQFETQETLNKAEAVLYAISLASMK